MSYVRFVPGFSRHPKRIDTGAVASWLWVCSVDHCNVHLTDGFLVKAVLHTLDPSIQGRTLKRAVESLVRVGSWVPVEGGYQVHDYLRHNQSKSQVERDRDAAANRYFAWRAKRLDNAVADTETTPQSQRRDNISLGRSVGRSSVLQRNWNKETARPPAAPRGGASHPGMASHLDPNPNGDDPHDQNATVEPDDEREEMRGDASWDAPEKREAPLAELEEFREAAELLAWFNAMTGRTYGEENLYVIDARLREGWSLQDCKTMCARKWNDWGDDERMRPFVRPSTLFGRGKLEQYMAELGYVRGAPR